MRNIQKLNCGFFLLWVAISLYSCANPQSLTGGEKDTAAPVIDTLASSVNPALNFKGKEFFIQFNEWIKIEDVYNQVVISPPLAYRPSIMRKGKGVLFQFDEREELKDSTTYIIQFGEAIKDITEGNVVSNLKYVLSTGNELDSLNLSGQVFDQVTGKGVKDVWVMLYANLADSVVRTEKPYYFAQTGADGSFKLDYLKKGKYKIFALKDVNANYLFDQPQEKIAFQEEFITLPDTTQSQVTLKLFQEDSPLLIAGKELRDYGVLKFIFNQNPTNLQTNAKDIFENPTFQHIVKDTLLLWYSDTSSLEKEIVIHSEEVNFRDTISFTLPKRSKVPHLHKGKKTNHILAPSDTLHFHFNTPLLEIDTSKIVIQKDTVNYQGKKEIQFIAKDKRSIFIALDLVENDTIDVTFLPDAVANIWKEKNKDTISHQAWVAPISEFGDMKIQFSFPDSTIQYLVYLQNPQGENIAEKIVQDTSTFSVERNTLPTGVYKVRVVEDVNRNGKQDAGNYNEKRQPERIFEKQLDALRKNWTLELDVPVEF